MAERLEQLDRMKRDFVSNVSHDLKTPLSSIQETTVAILDQLAGPLSERQRRLLELNQESGRRLSSMIAKLLELSRLESVRTPTFELVDLVPLACRAIDRANAARSMRQGERGRGPVATVADPETQVLVRADAEGITQLLDNLIENAVKFSPPDGRVTVTIEGGAADTGVILSIADEGPGIPDSDKERVFERFYQTETGRSVRSRGVGLGLSICRHIAGVHGGRIWVSDSVPRGAVVNVWLPGLATGTEHQVKVEPPTFAAASA
jgi:two-component system sensor histidine kinase GlrK